MSTTLAFVADLHIANHRNHGGAWAGGINNRGRETIDAVGNALSIAEAVGADRMVMLGDLFDTTKPEPQLIAGLAHMITEHLVEVRAIKGNHDENSSEVGDHALGPIHELERAEVFERPTFEVLSFGHATRVVHMLYVPFETGPAKDWLPQRLDELDAQTAVVQGGAPVRILSIHLGLHDQAMRGPSAFWAEKVNDAISAELLAAECYKRGIRAVFAGNWHGRRIMEFAFPTHPKTGLDTVTLVQVGTLCPTGWDNPGLGGYGGVALAQIADDGAFTLKFAEVPGPRFVNVNNLDELNKAIVEAGSNRLYARWHAKPAEVAHARQELTKAQESGSVVATDIAIDKEETQALAREAAQAAQSTTTMQAVLEAFVLKMPLPEGVSRDQVYNRCRNYLE